MKIKCQTKHRKKQMSSFRLRKRRISETRRQELNLPVLLLCLLFIAASLMLESFLLILSEHEHSSIDEMQSCAACASILQSGKQRMTADILRMLSAGVFCLLCSAAHYSFFYFTESSTPVSRKVRLNN